jgi:hypothetical protein
MPIESTKPGIVYPTGSIRRRFHEMTLARTALRRDESHQLLPAIQEMSAALNEPERKAIEVGARANVPSGPEPSQRPPVARGKTPTFNEARALPPERASWRDGE